MVATRHLAALAVGAVLVFAACGGDDDDGAAADSSDPAPPVDFGGDEQTWVWSELPIEGQELTSDGQFRGEAKETFVEICNVLLEEEMRPAIEAAGIADEMEHNPYPTYDSAGKYGDGFACNRSGAPGGGTAIERMDDGLLDVYSELRDYLDFHGVSAPGLAEEVEAALAERFSSTD